MATQPRSSSGTIGNVWEAPASDLTKAQQLESSALALLHIAPAAGGKILVTGLDNQLWIMNIDGSQRALLTDVHPASAPFVCGGFVFFLRKSVTPSTPEEDGLNNGEGRRQ